MKPRVLMIAYACDPQGSGEHWLGWGWAEQAARSFDVELITTPKARAAIEAGSAALGIRPHFVDVPAWLRRLTELCGGSWLRKLAWQKRIAPLAASLHERQPFSLVHQTTFHTFRVPFLAARLDVPSVWGPIAGGERVPPGFGIYLGSARGAEAGRCLVNNLCLHSPSVRYSLQRASTLFVSNHTTLAFLPAHCRAKSQIVAPNALRPQDEALLVRPPGIRAGTSPTFRLLYVGNCVATRAVPLVLEALQKSGLSAYEFFVVGEGPALESWKKCADRLGLAGKVKFVGKVPYVQLQPFYEQADALAFPALRDSGGSALLEAMARQIPVICLDWGGPAEMVDEQSGIKISVSTPQAAVQAFAQALVRLSREPALCASLGQAARERARAFFGWPAKRELLESTYRRLIRSP